VQVNQATMDMLYTAGVTRPQPINGPSDGEPEYLIPRQIYMRYITSPSVPNDNVNESPCLIDPSLLEDNTHPPQEQLPCPKPRRLAGGNSERGSYCKGEGKGTTCIRNAIGNGQSGRTSNGHSRLGNGHGTVGNGHSHSRLGNGHSRTDDTTIISKH
jgi:hypothetical protein